mmetsp:Transcript_33688/g.41468  ORF Transcript_33688/g.41468 Transcript_33688/m.41468 type:complete len:159 (+) Transcript_33688:43-519(+)|eukprot:CAMPEP_0114666788 /NCGR_PEP_ID=MMETSP0191-20121206/33229_1 /TAXON_ID=126664 /ORGANISM="Sorites sp." /LENGTH=158 /DNA_ID=CAMNT_0001915423 /DNA_START=39 /DNA_END=515 /DNA_ORIENTATION=-
MPGTGKADVSPSQFDMQWRTRVGCEEFWATFPVFSPRPEIHSEGLIPIRMGTSLRELQSQGKQSPGLRDSDSMSRRTSSIPCSEATPRKASNRQLSAVASHRSSQAVAALMLDSRSGAGSHACGGAIADLREQLQQERILRQKAEEEARQLRAKLSSA